MATFVDSRDSSFSSQSSSCEFGATWSLQVKMRRIRVPGQCIPGCQPGTRHGGSSKPELFCKVLMYQPLELAELQAELKQNGIRVPMGKLLETLDALCITFTTATAQKEKLKQKGQQRGRKKGERD
ncbi:Structure-specific endonuclease subunit SLX4 [Heterocephalus glaber]|uniref:Structure-specific endonuclease subunit SLX4 n=1 Tax=Heterocephalus glaber TaxID=10181 RepID=G5BC92_HETGA|nr:Structure-specific endonuclease subunit SLX4 [Heterocephalus glaber]